jgi:transposase
MSKVCWLNDAKWGRIEPPRERRGTRRVDDRRTISGIVYMLRSDAHWRDCPRVYGPYTTICNRLSASKQDRTTLAGGSHRRAM